MAIGYACIALSVKGAGLRAIVLKNADESRIMEVAAANLQALEHMVDYNIDNGIRMFRISSDMIPFGSHPVNRIAWWEILRGDFDRIGGKIKDSGMRVSMHPGQYTVLNSPDNEVVARAFEDLKYHTRFMDSLSVDSSHKIILHVGGIYGDKGAALQRFRDSYVKLPETVKARLVLENDEKSYTVEDVLALSQSLKIPAVFDNLHHALNPPATVKTDEGWIDLCKKTWKPQDGRQKIHYSQQEPGGKIGAHSQTIDHHIFMDYFHRLGPDHPDIMLEVKDKNISALKCAYCIEEKKAAKYLEREWARYKYLILEHSHKQYLEIRTMFRENNPVNAVEFYDQVAAALARPIAKAAAVNALQHVWGYFKDQAATREKNAFEKALNAYQSDTGTLKSVKNVLFRLAERYEQDYLLESYYFL